LFILYMSFDSYIKIKNIKHLNSLGTINSDKFCFVYIYIVVNIEITLSVTINVFDCFYSILI